MGDEVLLTQILFVYQNNFPTLFHMKEYTAKGVSLKKGNIIIYNSSFPYIIAMYIKNMHFYRMICYNLLE